MRRSPSHRRVDAKARGYQDEVVRSLLRIVGDEASIDGLPPEEDADLAKSDEEIVRREFATDEQVRILWAKHGL